MDVLIEFLISVKHRHKMSILVIISLVLISIQCPTAKSIFPDYIMNHNIFDQIINKCWAVTSTFHKRMVSLSASFRVQSHTQHWSQTHCFRRSSSLTRSSKNNVLTPNRSPQMHMFTSSAPSAYVPVTAPLTGSTQTLLWPPSQSPRGFQVFSHLLIYRVMDLFQD